MKTIVPAILYFIIGSVFIIIQDNASFFTELLIKGLIIPVLIFIFMVNLKSVLIVNKLLLAGLLFSWAGDVAIEFSFIPGLVCFLLTQIMYLTSFLVAPGKIYIKGWRLMLLIPVILYGVILVGYMYSDLSEMRLPVIIYAAIILAMLSAAINRKYKANRVSYYLVLAGAFLFVISDSVLAINKFTYHFKSSGTIIMLTYIIAQFLIVLGYIKQFRSDTE